jgi:hypothetical protein
MADDLLQQVWWPRMDLDLKDFGNLCMTCAVNKPGNYENHKNISEEVFACIHVDIMEMEMETTKTGYKYVLDIVDQHQDIK